MTSEAVTGPMNGQVANIRSSWTKGLAVDPVGELYTFCIVYFSNFLWEQRQALYLSQFSFLFRPT